MPDGGFSTLLGSGMKILFVTLFYQKYNICIRQSAVVSIMRGFLMIRLAKMNKSL